MVSSASGYFFFAGSEGFLPPANAKDMTNIAPKDCAILDRFWGAVNAAGQKAIQVRLKNTNAAAWDLGASKMVGGKFLGVSRQDCEIDKIDIGCSIYSDKPGDCTIQSLPHYMCEALLVKTNDAGVVSGSDGPYLRLNTKCMCDVYVCWDLTQPLPQWLVTTFDQDMDVSNRRFKIWERMPEVLSVKSGSKLIKYVILRKRFASKRISPGKSDITREVVLNGAGNKCAGARNFFCSSV